MGTLKEARRETGPRVLLARPVVSSASLKGAFHFVVVSAVFNWVCSLVLPSVLFLEFCHTVNLSLVALEYN